jgi:hypothetical protein
MAPTLAPTAAPTETPTADVTDDPTPGTTSEPPTEPPPTEPPTDSPTSEPSPSMPLLDFSKTSNYGSVELESGFLPDPHTKDLKSGGSIDASYLGDDCSGFVTSAPDYEVKYRAGERDLLRFYFVGEDRHSSDTTLIVNDPAGNWYCNSDSYDDIFPTVDFTDPAGGTYDVWIGSVEDDLNWKGTLFITELDENHP